MPVRLVRRDHQYHRDFVRLFETSVQLTATRFLKLEAEALSKEMKEIILGQRYAWYPLSPQYLREKVRQGFDPRILIRTKQYVENIQVFGPEDTPHGVRFTVNVPEGEHNSKLPFRELGRILEFGRRDGKKPYARPHWRPTWGIYVRDKEMTADYFGDELMSDFRNRLHAAL